MGLLESSTATWLLIAFLMIWPLASAISFQRAMRRQAERRRQKRLAAGRSVEPDTRRRWKTYSRNTAWNRYSID